jgi:hypothetical protein
MFKWLFKEAPQQQEVFEGRKVSTEHFRFLFQKDKNYKLSKTDSDYLIAIIKEETIEEIVNPHHNSDY